MKEITSAELEVVPISKEPEKNTDLARKDSADSEVVGISEMLQDPELLKRLEEILAGASFDEAKECPYNGILTLTKADGTQVDWHWTDAIRWFMAAIAFIRQLGVKSRKFGICFRR